MREVEPHRPLVGPAGLHDKATVPERACTGLEGDKDLPADALAAPAGVDALHLGYVVTEGAYAAAAYGIARVVGDHGCRLRPLDVGGIEAGASAASGHQLEEVRELVDEPFCVGSVGWCVAYLQAAHRMCPLVCCGIPSGSEGHPSVRRLLRMD